MATVTVQPSTQDVFLSQSAPTTNYNSKIYMNVISESPVANRRSILQFAIPSDLLDGGKTLASATLYLYAYYFFESPEGRTYWVYRLTQPGWLEAQATWNTYKTGTNWASAGGDYTATDGASADVPGSLPAWMSWTITALVQDAIDNRSNQLHLLVKDGTESASDLGPSTRFYSSEYPTDPTLCPKLVLEVNTPPTVTTQAADDITTTTATLNGTVTDDGGETVDYVGFVYGKVSGSDPGDVDPSTTPGNYTDYYKSSVGDYGENPFDAAISSLDVGTRYYARACARNANGWDYGDEVYFDTLGPTHEISGTIRLLGVGVEGARAFIFTMAPGSEALESVETADENGHYVHRDYGIDDLYPRYGVAFFYDVKASLTTEFAAANSNLTITAKDPDYPGKAGNSLTIALVDTGSVSVSVAGTDITVNVDAGVTLASAVKAAIEGDATANAMIAASYPDGNDGSGAVEALAETNLAGGKYYIATPQAWVTPGESA